MSGYKPREPGTNDLYGNIQAMGRPAMSPKSDRLIDGMLGGLYGHSRVYNSPEPDVDENYMMNRATAAQNRPDPFFNMYDNMTTARENEQPGAERAFGPLQDALRRYMQQRGGR